MDEGKQEAERPQAQP